MLLRPRTVGAATERGSVPSFPVSGCYHVGAQNSGPPIARATGRRARFDLSAHVSERPSLAVSSAGCGQRARSRLSDSDVGGGSVAGVQNWISRGGELTGVVKIAVLIGMSD